MTTPSTGGDAPIESQGPAKVVAAVTAGSALSEKSLALCYAIEAAGASEALTKCSVLASELRTEIVTETARLARLSESMKRFVAEYYPPDKNGQVHFARALVEVYAQEIVAPEELNIP